MKRFCSNSQYTTFRIKQSSQMLLNNILFNYITLLEINIIVLSVIKESLNVREGTS